MSSNPALPAPPSTGATPPVEPAVIPASPDSPSLPASPPPVQRSRDYLSFLGTAGETHAASFIALRGYVVAMPMTDIGEDLFASDPGAATVLRVQVKTARRTQPDGVAATPNFEEFEETEADADGDQQDSVGDLPTQEPVAVAAKAGRPRNEKEQAKFAVNIKRTQLEKDVSGLIFVFVIVVDRKFRRFVLGQPKLRELLSAGKHPIFKSSTARSKGIVLTIDADDQQSGAFRIGGTGKTAISMAPFEDAWDDAFPPTKVCVGGGG